MVMGGVVPSVGQLRAGRPDGVYPAVVARHPRGAVPEVVGQQTGGLTSRHRSSYHGTFVTRGGLSQTALFRIDFSSILLYDEYGGENRCTERSTGSIFC